MDTGYTEYHEQGICRNSIANALTTDTAWLAIPAAAIDTEIEMLTDVIKTLRPAVNTGILWALEGTLDRLTAMHRQFPTIAKPEVS